MASKVKRETMRTCLSCPLCENLLHDATTISECLHTFCRKCIYERITEDEIENCPVCNLHLGGSPLEKLKSDHNLQDLRDKLFPLKRRKGKGHEIVSFPAKMKEKSMSSLVASTLKVSAKGRTRGRRSKSVRRTVKSEEPSEDSKMDNILKTIDYLLDVVNKAKHQKPSYASASQGSGSVQAKDNKRKCKDEDEKGTKGHDPTASVTTKPKKLRRTQSTTLTVSDSRKRRNVPVWFSLVASTNQEIDTCLPQIPSNFLRIRDGSIPVSFVHKYLMRKLNLQSETEIEVRCMGEAVMPTLNLDKLVDKWIQKTSKGLRFTASVGSSAKEYMVVLVYARKLTECNT